MNRSGKLLDYRYYARAPMRISLAGGGTDVGNYPEMFGGAALNCTITIYAYASMVFREDSKIVINDNGIIEEFESAEQLYQSKNHDVVRAVLKRFNKAGYGLELCLFFGTRPRSGLGGSAACFVALLSIFNHLEREEGLDKYSLAELAHELERDDLGNLGGRQDQYASVFGGLNYIEFLQNGFVRVTPLRLSEAALSHLSSSLALFWLGDRSRSGRVIEDQIDNIQSGRNMEALHSAKALTREMKLALLRGDVHQAGCLLGEGWKAKRQFSKMVTSSEIDAFHDCLMNEGMVGGKITGAGGGGHFLAYVELESRQRVIDAAVRMGAQYIPVGLEFEGAVSWQVGRSYS